MSLMLVLSITDAGGDTPELPDEHVVYVDTSDSAWCLKNSSLIQCVRVYHHTQKTLAVPLTLPDGAGLEDATGGAGAMRFLPPALAGAFTEPLAALVAGSSGVGGCTMPSASADFWFMSRRLLRLATASSASRFDTSTGEGGRGVAGGGGSGGGSSDRVGEMLRSPTLSLLTLLSPILCKQKKHHHLIRQYPS